MITICKLFIKICKVMVWGVLSTLRLCVNIPLAIVKLLGL